MAPRPGGNRARRTGRRGTGTICASAARAQARGGIAAASSFLERAATLTPEPAERVRRLLAAARSKRDAGALDAALELVSAAEAGPVSAVQAAELEHLRGEIAFDQQRVGDAARLLGSAAKRLEPLDAERARGTHLEAIGAAIWAADLTPRGARSGRAGRSRRAARAPIRRRGGYRARRVGRRRIYGYTAAAPALRQALLETVLSLTVERRSRPLAVADGRARDRADRDRARGPRLLAWARLAPGPRRPRCRRAVQLQFASSSARSERGWAS